MPAKPETVRGVLRELLVVCFAAVTYGGVRALTEGSAAQAVANGESVERFERTLGIAWEHAAQSAVLGSPVLVSAANWMYIWGHWPVIIASATVLYVRRPVHYRVLRNAIISSGLLGFVFFYSVPTAPPRLLPNGLSDTVLEHSHAYRALQPPSLTNQYAALPSLHFGWNLLVGVVLFVAFTRLTVRCFAVADAVCDGRSPLLRQRTISSSTCCRGWLWQRSASPLRSHSSDTAAPRPSRIASARNRSRAVLGPRVH